MQRVIEEAEGVVELRGALLGGQVVPEPRLRAIGIEKGQEGGRVRGGGEVGGKGVGGTGPVEPRDLAAGGGVDGAFIGDETLEAGEVFQKAGDGGAGGGIERLVRASGEDEEGGAGGDDGEQCGFVGKALEAAGNEENHAAAAGGGFHGDPHGVAERGGGRVRGRAGGFEGLEQAVGLIEFAAVVAGFEDVSAFAQMDLGEAEAIGHDDAAEGVVLT